MIQPYAFSGQGMAEEALAVGGEPTGIVCCDEAAVAIAGQAGFAVGVAVKPVCQTCGDDLALGEEFDRWRYDAAQCGQKQRIMGAAKQNPFWRLRAVEHGVERAAQEVFRAWAVEFARFDHRCPERTGLLDELELGREFAQFEAVGIGGDGAFGAEHSDHSGGKRWFGLARNRARRKAGEGFD